MQQTFFSVYTSIHAPNQRTIYFYLPLVNNKVNSNQIIDHFHFSSIFCHQKTANCKYKFMCVIIMTTYLYIFQSLLAVSVSLAYFSIGLVRGWSAPSIPSIHDTIPELLPSKNIASWASEFALSTKFWQIKTLTIHLFLGSVPPLGAFFGSLTAAPLMHKIGRKYTVLLTSPIWAVSWTAIALSQRFEVVIAGRLLSGFAAGLTIPSAQIFVSECSSAQIRGVLGSLPSMSMSIGILVTFIMGKYWPWDTLAWICCTFTGNLQCHESNQHSP
jgi:MFS family permease